MLLKRTTATAAVRTFGSMLGHYPDIFSLALAKQSELIHRLKPIGLQNQRASALMEAASYIIQEFRGSVPCSLELLCAVPHIGPYTARAVLCVAYDLPLAAVDSNVVRILRRVFADHLSADRSAKTIQQVADVLLPPESHKQHNWALLDMGSLVCRPIRPRCAVCPVSSVCDSRVIPGDYTVRRSVLSIAADVPRRDEA